MSPRHLKGLLLKGSLFLALGLILWVLVQPAYSRLLVSVSQAVLSLAEKKEKTFISLQDSMIVYVPLGLSAKGQKGVPAGKREVRDLHYNSVILFALILFSPDLRLKRRLWILGVGLLLLFFTQVLTVLVQVQFFYTYQLGEYSRTAYGPWEKNLFAFLKQFFELIGRFAFPFAIWMLFTYRETIGYLTGSEPEEKPSRKKKRSKP